MNRAEYIISRLMIGSSVVFFYLGWDITSVLAIGVGLHMVLVEGN